MAEMTTDIAHLIQSSVAPVFLLTGVAAMLGVLTNRLARIVDRARTLLDPTRDSERVPPRSIGGGRAHERRQSIECACALLRASKRLRGAFDSRVIAKDFVLEVQSRPRGLRVLRSGLSKVRKGRVDIALGSGKTCSVYEQQCTPGRARGRC